ncbi:MAG: hypothetical protein C5B58_14020 [Acidobacteria bacterium]|nr:MAG: hypothetical protein C5B58_14020 [Acidobacteriota bacterium]
MAKYHRIVTALERFKSGLPFHSCGPRLQGEGQVEARQAEYEVDLRRYKSESEKTSAGLKFPPRILRL